VLIVTAGGDLHDQRRRLRQIFDHAIVIKHHREHIDHIRDFNKKLVWYVPSNMTMAMVGIDLDKMATDELSSACLASRFFGGYIADDEWLAACEATFPITGTVPEPMVHMLPGIHDQLELLIHSSVKDAAGWAMKVLSCVDGTVNPRSRWVVRLDRLGIKNNARAIVLFASDASVHKDVKRKAKFKDKLKKSTGSCHTHPLVRLQVIIIILKNNSGRQVRASLRTGGSP
jgi:hypothetical protein